MGYLTFAKSIDRELIRSTIQAMIPEDIPVVYHSEPEPFMSKQTMLKLRIGSFRSAGQDDYVQTLDEDSNLLNTNTQGIRYFTLSITAECDDEDPLIAIELLETIRRRSANDYFAGLLRAGNMCWDPGDVIDVEIKNWDNREIRAAVLDMMMGVAINHADEEDQGQGWIEFVTPDPIPWEPFE